MKGVLSGFISAFTNRIAPSARKVSPSKPGKRYLQGFFCQTGSKKVSQGPTWCGAGGRVFGKQDLSGARFSHCDLSETSFEGTVLSNAVFRNCYVTEASVSFANADAAGVTLEGCRLERSIFRSARLLGATVRGSSLERADLYNCCLDDADLVEVNLARTNLHLASLRNVKIVDVKFRPALRTRAGSVFKLLWQDEIETRTIFTAGTELSPFVAHCAREYRLSQLAADLVSRRRLWRAPNVLFVSLFGVASDFGSSLWRWFAVTSAVVGGFAAYFALLKQTRTVGDAIAMSALNFVGASTHVPGAPTSAIVVEHVTGYFMLGLLISVLTFKFVERW